MYFPELRWFVNELRARKLKSFGNCTLETGFHSFKKGCQMQDCLNSSDINHLAPPGNFLFLALSVIEKKIHKTYIIPFILWL